jgi:hypothetical protein
MQTTHGAVSMMRVVTLHHWIVDAGRAPCIEASATGYLLPLQGASVRLQDVRAWRAVQR